MLTLRLTVRVRLHDDPRPGLREEGVPYAYAILHAHQVSAMMMAERGTCAMVSRSGDGVLILPMLRLQGVVAVRGSTRKGEGARDRGGTSALDAMIEHVADGAPGYLAVDGPRGPRGHVHRGIARLAIATGAAVLVALPVPRRRWILARAWDRMQIPAPFTRVDFYFGEPVRAAPDETVEALCERIARALAALESAHDPDEAAAGIIAAERQRERLAARALAHAESART